MRRDFGPKSFNNAPTKGYGSFPRYVAERESSLANVDNSQPANRRARRLARRVVGSLEPETERKLGNTELPIYEFGDQIVQEVKNNQVTIIVAETGAGKSTQVPQFLYEAGFLVKMTQPRRPAARNVAERIGQEIREKDSSLPLDIVGYHTAEKNTLTSTSRIQVLTDGLELAKQLNDHGIQENEVIVIDEVHERNQNIDVLMAWTHKRIAENPNIKVVIMSATVDASKIANYYSDVTDFVPSIVEVPGRTYGVDKAEFPESTVVERTLLHADRLNELFKQQADLTKEERQPTGIMVALPGKRQIRDIHDELLRTLPPDILKNARILELHSQMSAQTQQEIYVENPNGIVITLTTNIAKTSLTVPNTAVVIDSGVERRPEIDNQVVGSLPLSPTAQADCIQWAGRAGRVAPGIYELTRLDKYSEYVPFIERQEYPTPEILRSGVESIILKTAASGIDISELKFLNPIEQHVIQIGMESLMTLGALNDDGRITRRGYRMDKFSARPYLARMMVESDLYSPQVKTKVAAMVAAIEAGGLPFYGPESTRSWQELTTETESDLLAQLDLFIETQEMDARKIASYDLNVQAVVRARELYEKYARRMDVQPSEVMHPTPQERELILRCIYAGQLDFTYEYAGEGEYERISGSDQHMREISNRSFVKGSPHFTVAQPFRVEIPAAGRLKVKHILENVSVVKNPAVFGEIAIELCKWSPVEEVRWRGGRPVEVRRQLFNGADVGITQEFEPEASLQLREIIINYAIENPGPAQRKLRAIKVEIERLRHLSKDRLPQFTQDMLIEWINASAPQDILDPSIIDYNIRVKMETENFNLDALVSPEQRQKIYHDAVTEILVENVRLKIEYSKGKPLAKNVSRDTIEKLSQEVYLPDGRQVKFVGEHGKYHSLADLKEK